MKFRTQEFGATEENVIISWKWEGVNLVSMACVIFEASKQLGPPRIQVMRAEGPATLEANTMRFRDMFLSRIQRPTYSSLLP